MSRLLSRAKTDLTPERAVEGAQQVADYRVDHLLMEVRIAIARLKATVPDDVGLIKINRRMKLFPIGIFVHHCDTVPNWTWLQPLEGHAQDQVIAVTTATARIESVDTQRTIGRLVLPERIRSPERIVARSPLLVKRT